LGNFWITSVTISFSGRALYHGVGWFRDRVGSSGFCGFPKAPGNYNDTSLSSKITSGSMIQRVCLINTTTAGSI